MTDNLRKPKSAVFRAKAAGRARQITEAERGFLARVDAIVATSSDPLALIASAQSHVAAAIEESQAESQEVAVAAKAQAGQTVELAELAHMASAVAVRAKRRVATQVCIGGRVQKVVGGGSRFVGSGGYSTSTSIFANRWFVGANTYGEMLHQDMAMRAALKKRFYSAGVSRIIIERPRQACRVTIYAARPGLIAGRGGGELAELRETLSAMTQCEVQLNLCEVRKPLIDAQLIAEVLAQRLQQRVGVRRALRCSISSAMNVGVAGIRINVSGRLGAGHELGRMEWYREGRAPLNAQRADIDFGFAEARTDKGVVGVKAWIFKGEGRGSEPAAASEGGGAQSDGRFDGKKRRRRRDRI